MNAVQKHFQGVAWQRSQVHVARNALWAVLNAPNVDWARRLKGEVVERWDRTHPHEAEWLESALEDGLACFAFPESNRRRIRSTNGLEHINQKLERRTRVVRIFPNREAFLRLVTALCVEQSEEWLAGCVCLDTRKLDAIDADQAPLATVSVTSECHEEVKTMAANADRPVEKRKYTRART